MNAPVQARLKPLLVFPPEYRASCGGLLNAGQYCPGPLGVFRSRWQSAVYSAEFAAGEIERAARDTAPGEWLLFADEHAPGFRQRPDGVFEFVRGKKQRNHRNEMRRTGQGRRHGPQELDAAREQIGTYNAESRTQGIAGRFPQVGDAVRCPVCGRLNQLPEPAMM